MDPRQLVIAGSARFADHAAVLPLGRDDLHDLGPLDALGMPRRIRVVRKPI